MKDRLHWGVVDLASYDGDLFSYGTLNKWTIRGLSSDPASYNRYANGGAVINFDCLGRE